MLKKIVMTGVLAVTLAGCGANVGQQALYGGGVGAVGAAAVGGDPLLGAVVGAGGNVLFCNAYGRRC